MNRVSSNVCPTKRCQYKSIFHFVVAQKDNNNELGRAHQRGEKITKFFLVYWSPTFFSSLISMAVISLIYSSVQNKFQTITVNHLYVPYRLRLVHILNYYVTHDSVKSCNLVYHGIKNHFWDGLSRLSSVCWPLLHIFQRIMVFYRCLWQLVNTIVHFVHFFSILSGKLTKNREPNLNY